MTPRTDWLKQKVAYTIFYWKSFWNGKTFWPFVPPIHAFIGCFLYVPWPGMGPATLVYLEEALTNWANWPGLNRKLLIFIFSHQKGSMKSPKWFFSVRFTKYLHQSYLKILLNIYARAGYISWLERCPDVPRWWVGSSRHIQEATNECINK